MSYPSSPYPNNIEMTKREFLVDRITAEDGTTYSRLKRTAVRRSWRLQYVMLGTTDASTIRNHYDAQKGPYSSESWTHPYDSATYTVRIADYKEDIAAYPRVNIQVTLEEV